MGAVNITRLEPIHKIYVISFPASTSGKIYIGYTRTSIRRRMIEHMKFVRKGIKTPLAYAIRKYKKFSVKVVATFADKQDAFEHEKKLIARYRGKSYNVGSGGECFPDGFNGSYWMVGKTEEQIREINSRKARPGSSNPFFGRRHDPETMRRAVATRRERGSYNGSGSAVQIQYQGVVYPSKIEFQRQTGIKRWTFDRMVARGDVVVKES